VTLGDAGGGAGTWDVSLELQNTLGTVEVPATVDVPGTLTVTAVAGVSTGDETGFVVLTRGTDTRRIPLWFESSAPQLGSEPRPPLPRAGIYKGTTRGAPSRVTLYRYPTAGRILYSGPERAYRIRIGRRVANFGVVVLSGRVTPHVTFDGAEDHLTGYASLPVDLNPYRESYGESVPVSAGVLPAPGVYDIVFDTRSATDAGPFSFRLWIDDTTPPKLRVRSARGGIQIVATDSGSGVDPSSIHATVDGRTAAATWLGGVIRVAARPGRHHVAVRVADYEETKNMEDVPPVLPNTATLRATVRVR
jgi:hypothetical protein